MAYTFNGQEMLTRIVKYLILGLTIGLVAYLLPNKSLNFSEVILLSLTAAATFSILDLLAPAVSVSALQGVGLGVGFGLMPFL